jgi:Zn-finger nucleic acid-binding protein
MTSDAPPNAAGLSRDEGTPIACPKCGGGTEKVTYAGVTIDRCLACHGLWFDAREQERLRDVDGSEAIDLGPADPHRPAEAHPTSKILCPVCRSPMIEMTDHQHPGLRFEGCTVCYGAFFDAGEFRQFKETSVVQAVKRLFRWRR